MNKIAVCILALAMLLFAGLALAATILDLTITKDVLAYPKRDEINVQRANTDSVLSFGINLAGAIFIFVFMFVSIVLSLFFTLPIGCFLLGLLFPILGVLILKHVIHFIDKYTSHHIVN